MIWGTPLRSCLQLLLSLLISLLNKQATNRCKDTDTLSLAIWKRSGECLPLPLSLHKVVNDSYIMVFFSICCEQPSRIIVVHQLRFRALDA